MAPARPWGRGADTAVHECLNAGGKIAEVEVFHARIRADGGEGFAVLEITALPELGVDFLLQGRRAETGVVDGREGAADHGGGVVVAFVGVEVGIARLDLADADHAAHIAVLGGKDAAVVFEEVDEVVGFDGVAGGVADRHREVEGERVFTGVTGFHDIGLEAGVMAEETIEGAVAVAGAATPLRKIKGLLHDLGLRVPGNPHESVVAAVDEKAGGVFADVFVDRTGEVVVAVDKPDGALAHHAREEGADHHALGLAGAHAAGVVEEVGVTGRGKRGADDGIALVHDEHLFAGEAAEIGDRFLFEEEAVDGLAGAVGDDDDEAGIGDADENAFNEFEALTLDRHHNGHLALHAVECLSRNFAGRRYGPRRGVQIRGGLRCACGAWFREEVATRERARGPRVPQPPVPYRRQSLERTEQLGQLEGLFEPVERVRTRGWL